MTHDRKSTSFTNTKINEFSYVDNERFESMSKFLICNSSTMLISKSIQIEFLHIVCRAIFEKKLCICKRLYDLCDFTNFKKSWKSCKKLFSWWKWQKNLSHFLHFLRHLFWLLRLWSLTKHIIVMCARFSINARNQHFILNDDFTYLKTKYLKKNYETNDIDHSNIWFEKKRK